jgi:hypothetical protein
MIDLPFGKSHPINVLKLPDTRAGDASYFFAPLLLCFFAPLR